MRLAIAGLLMILGGLGAVGGGAMLLIGLLRATIGANEGGAMQAGGGLVILLPALVVLGVGRRLRPRQTSAPVGG